MKRKLAIAAALTAFCTAAWASCTTYTIYRDGRTVMCTQCCYGGHCTVTCF